MFRGNIKGGVREAAKILQMLTIKERAKLLEQIALSDPKMAELLKKNMVVFEDLRYLTVQMIGELLRDIDINELALALKIGSKELKGHILSNVSRGIKSEIEDVLNGRPEPLSKVEEAKEKIMSVVRQKVERGELVLDPIKSEEYV